MSSPKNTFLTTLPPEIRCQIYSLFFGDKIIAFVPAENNHIDFGYYPIVPAKDMKITHGVCPAQGEKFHYFNGSFEDGSSGCYCTRHERERGGRGRVSLLLACREIYTEAFPVLWTQNPLHIQMMNGPQDFMMFPKLQIILTPLVLNTIRTLEISFIHPNVRRHPQILCGKWLAGWDGVWAVVKEMKALRKIRAWLKMDHRRRRGMNGNYMTVQQEEKFFAPMMDVAHVRDFQVEVTWLANAGSEELLRDAPFRVIRNGEAVPDKPVIHEVDPEPISACTRFRRRG